MYTIHPLQGPPSADSYDSQTPLPASTRPKVNSGQQGFTGIHLPPANSDVMPPGFVEVPEHKMGYGHGEHRRAWWASFIAPEQVKEKHRVWVKWLGRVGWVCKGIVYALIGGLAADSATEPDNASGQASPQGAFILVGGSNFGEGVLGALAAGVGVYATWRFWEAFTGQGTDQTMSTFMNFFRYRLSPFVSGCVYTLYMVFCALLLAHNDNNYGNNSTIPNAWNKSALGIAGLVLLGTAFTIATITQLQSAFTKQFHYDCRHDLPEWFWWIVLVSGHIGFLARAGVFLFVGVLFFRAIRSNVGGNETTIDNALTQLKTNTGGRIVLFCLGVGLIVYGLFAVLNSYARVFPTPPPSRRPRLRRPPAPTRLAAHPEHPASEAVV